MNELTCSEVDELLPAYAVDALVEEERCAFLEHLAECRLHDDELAGYRDVTGRLPDTVDFVDPPEQLRDRVLADFDALVAGVTPTVRAPNRRFVQVLKSPTFAYAIAAVLALLAIGLAAFAASRGGGEDVTQLSVSQDGMSLRFVYLSDRQLAVFDVDLPQLAAGRTYQAWQIKDGAPVSVGLLSNRGVNAFRADLSDADAIAISVEPAGGSPAPTTTPILVQEL